MPEGVFQVATGRGDTGAALIDEVDFIISPAPPPPARRSWTRAAETLTPVSLELGGKDPMIVLADADLERAANAAVHYSMFNGGQTCISHRARLRRGARLRRVRGQGHREGPRAAQRARRRPGHAPRSASMTFPPQVDIVERHVQDAVDKGAEVIVGGARGHDGEGGNLYEPTVLDRRRPLDGDHARGDLRADAADHEGRATPRRPSAWPTTRPYGLARFGLHQGRGTRRGRRAAHRGGRGVRQRRAGQLLGARAADGRREVSRASATATAPTGSASSLTSRRCWSRACTRGATCTCIPYSAKMTTRLSKLVRFLYGRGKRD